MPVEVAFLFKAVDWKSFYYENGTHFVRGLEVSDLPPDETSRLMNGLTMVESLTVH